MSGETPTNAGGAGRESSTTTQGRGGRGRGRSGRGGRGHGGRGRTGQQRGQQSSAASLFKGKTEDLSGHVYDLSDIRKASTQYIETTREIVEYIGRKYTEGRRIKAAIEDMVQPTVDEPDPPLAPAGYANPDAPTPAERARRAAYTREQARYPLLLKQAIQAQRDLENDMFKTYNLIIGQCTPRLMHALEARQAYERVNERADPIGLLQLIRAETRQDKEQKHPAVGVTNALRSLMAFRQGDMSNDRYIKEFRNTVEALTDKGISLKFRAMTEWRLSQLDPPVTYDNATADQRTTAETAGREELLAVIMMTGASQKKYGRLIEDMGNDYLKGSDRYPSNMTQTANLLNNWKQDPRNYAQVLGSINDGVAFTQQQGGQNGVVCYRCGRQGHIATYCQETTHTNGTALATEGHEEEAAEQGTEDEVGVQFLTINNIFHQSNAGGGLTPNTVLLDSCSDVDVFCNPKLLTNIRDVGRRMTIRSTAGVSVTTQMGTLKGYGKDVWYFPGGVANILALCNVEDNFEVKYKPGEFTVVRPDGSERKFQRVGRGIYGCDITVRNEDGSAFNSQGTASETMDLEGFSALETVEEKASKYTARQYKQALLARRVQNSIGFPTTRDFLKIVSKNLIQDCPVTRDDVLIAEDIFGANLGALKGKTVRRNAPHVRTEYTGVPPQLIKTFQNVTLAVDIMFVNKIPFFVSVSRNLKFRTAEAMDGRRAEHALKALKGAMSLYPRRGFEIKTVLGDNEFGVLKDDIAQLGANLDCAAVGAHVPEIERQIRTIKERCRCVYGLIPYNRIPKLMVRELVYWSVMWLNSFPEADGVSSEMSPREIMTGRKVSYRSCQLEFGTYVQTHEEHNNDMTERTIGAIALRPSGNAQGGHYFMSLSTGARIHRKSWTELPITRDVVDRVHYLADQSNAPPELAFAWRDGSEITGTIEDYIEDDGYGDEDYVDSGEEDVDELEYDDSEDPADLGDDDVNFDEVSSEDDSDESFEPEEDASTGVGEPDASTGVDSSDESTGVGGSDEDMNDHEEDAVMSDETTGVDDIGEDIGEVQNDELNLGDDSAPYQDVGLLENSETGSEDNPSDDDVDGGDEYVDETEIEEMEVDEGEDEGLNAEMDARYGPRTGRYNLRGRRQPRFDYRTGYNFMTMDEHLSVGEKMSLSTDQMNMHQGLKAFGKTGEDAVTAELKQLHDRETVSPRMPNHLTAGEKKRALQYLMFLKRKRCGRVKARGCADGRPQRLYKGKEETSAPTARLESILLTSVIDAHEGREVVTCDIPGAFMQTDIDEVVHVKLQGKWRNSSPK